jgi:hypothetical protein
MNKISIAFAVLVLSAPLAAQRGTVDSGQDLAARELVLQKLAGEYRARVAVEAKTTTGAPYSAEAVTEAVQTLADGNRISRKSITRVYRDGDGRTRREELDETGTVISISIVDPVSHVSYVLDPATRSAYRDQVLLRTPMLARGRGLGPADTAAKLEAESRARGSVESRRSGTDAPPPPPPPPLPGAPGTRVVIEETAGAGVVTENLGQQTVEGVNAAGTRSTTTIPAGAIGNLQPIKVVAEQWLSPDLQILVMTKHSDPRSGDTTYRLQNIVRAEPDRSLFTVPPDFTLKESGIREPEER